MERMMFFKDSTTIQPNCAYHITERSALAQILSEGLKPQIGKRSEKAHESKPLNNKQELIVSKPSAFLLGRILNERDY